MEQRYSQIAERLDDLSGTEKLFVLWYLLPKYADDLEKEYQNAGDNKTEFMACVKAIEHARVAREIASVLTYGIF